MDSGRTELDIPPICFYCDAKKGLIERERKLLSPQVMADRMKAVGDRMMENLRKAWGLTEDQWPKDPEEEMQLLEAMASGQDLQKALASIGKGMIKNAGKKK